MKNDTKLVFEISKPGAKGYTLPQWNVQNNTLSEYQHLLRSEKAALPEISEVDLVRHYTQLSNKNFGVDTGFYPLGSCTMKYNPKVNEKAAAFEGFTEAHPYQGDEKLQGSLALMYDLSEKLKFITGMDSITLQPAAGAHGELTGLMLIRKYHESRNDFNRTQIIIPDSAHGTNPASAKVAGMDVIEVSSNSDGRVDINSLKNLVCEKTAGLMLTNPNTLGLFEKDILEISHIIHEAGGLVYYDGANLNAILGNARPGDMGFDVVHLNLHKTFSTPHGGGGPGSGPVGVKSILEPFLPVPVIEEKDGYFYTDYNRPQSIGKVKSFFGNFAVLVRAYTYILMLGDEGLEEAGKLAVLNASYLRSRLEKVYDLGYDTLSKHEFVLCGIKGIDAHDISTMDIAKRLLDYGYHPPTVYFPLIVHEALMIEPTETESKETLDAFADVLLAIAKEAKEQPELLKNAPQTTPIGRVDDVLAARKPILKYQD